MLARVASTTRPLSLGLTVLYQTTILWSCRDSWPSGPSRGLECKHARQCMKRSVLKRTLPTGQQDDNPRLHNLRRDRQLRCEAHRLTSPAPVPSLLRLVSFVEPINAAIQYVCSALTSSKATGPRLLTIQSSHKEPFAASCWMILAPKPRTCLLLRARRQKQCWSSKGHGWSSMRIHSDLTLVDE